MWTLTVHMYHWCSALTLALATSINLWGFEMLQHSVNSPHILDIHYGQRVHLKLKIDLFSYFFYFFSHFSFILSWSLWFTSWHSCLTFVCSLTITVLHKVEMHLEQLPEWILLSVSIFCHYVFSTFCSAELLILYSTGFFKKKFYFSLPEFLWHLITTHSVHIDHP